MKKAMKKLLVILAIAVAFSDCNGATDTAKSAADSTAVKPGASVNATVDSANAFLDSMGRAVPDSGVRNDPAPH
jgi:PBP1b-binding outer membrane lipoprotein LpoB